VGRRGHHPHRPPHQRGLRSRTVRFAKHPQRGPAHGPRRGTSWKTCSSPCLTGTTPFAQDPLDPDDGTVREDGLTNRLGNPFHDRPRSAPWTKAVEQVGTLFVPVSHRDNPIRPGPFGP
jgi:hypothetical protein